MQAQAANAKSAYRVRSVPRSAVIGIFILLLIAGAAYARDFLTPMVLAFLLALIFSPVRRFLEHRGIPSGVSAVFIVGVLVIFLIGGVLLLAEPVTNWIDSAPRIGQQLEKKVRSLFGSAQAVMEAGEKVAEVGAGGKGDDVQEVVVREPNVFAKLASVAPTFLAQAMFVVVLLLFLLSSGDMFYEKLVRVMPTFKDKRRAVQIAYDIERKLSRYLFMITLINAGLGLAIGLTMWLIGMPNPLLFGVISFIFNYVPYFGAAAGVFIATMVGLITFNDLGYALLAGTTYFALTTVEGQLITPHLVGRRLKINTVVIFLSIAFFTWLWSVMGMLIAVPLLVTIRAFCENISQLEPIGHFLSARDGAVADDETG